MSSSDEDLHDLPAGIHGRTKATRSSKACDTCRKQKSKCERPDGSNKPCRNCVLLATPCTSLRPSRKRGPPKGYIDRLECALHQSEALLGIILASAQASFSASPESPELGDPRAQSLLDDLRADPLAKQILDRVDRTTFGISGRNRLNNANKTTLAKESGVSEDGVDISTTHPSNEWQESVLELIKSRAMASASSIQSHPPVLKLNPANIQPASGPSFISTTSIISSDGRNPRQRRRLDDGRLGSLQSGASESSPSPQNGILDYVPSSPSFGMHVLGADLSTDNTYRNSTLSTSTSSGEAQDQEFKERGEDPDWTGAIGQLSLNEDDEVRYHGRASGLHLLGNRERDDGRNLGGIWRFPKARVWPPLASDPASAANTIRTSVYNGFPNEADLLVHMPDIQNQQLLLDAYFTCVHPYFPILMKQSFLDDWKHCLSYPSPSESSDSPTASSRRSPARTVPPLLLFTVFSIAARYSQTPPTRPASPTGTSTAHSCPPMWDGGDDFFELAKAILNKNYAAPRPSTCQALLLLAYREIGIGAMAQSWIYTGMAIRMAQDLGLHRSADGWARAGLGGKLFSADELQERKRIWYACVVMDKYVSAYIGRPLAIYERDFDTRLPDELEAEELEDLAFPAPHEALIHSGPSRLLSCFNASSTLSGILSRIIQVIYTVRPLLRRRAESVFLEGILDKWYFELPHHLRHDPSSTKQPVPPPPVLTLHMQYWCAVLLLHRPLRTTQDEDDSELRSFVERSDDLCAAAANHYNYYWSTLYAETYDLTKGPVFLCYYLFTAGIMHVSTLSSQPSHPQAHLGFSRCIDALRALEIIWPSAGRAFVLLRGATDAPAPSPTRTTTGTKRPADPSFDTPTTAEELMMLSAQPYYSHLSDPFHQPQPPTSSVQTYYYPHPMPSQSEPFAGALSTSVLPQMYSTGMPSTGLRHDPRYPQYWHDYGAFAQLGTTFPGDLSNGSHQPTQPPMSPIYSFGSSLFNAQP
ncbi:fungal-specific transcription factor domain-containing protein [Flagelloscypha sp. PMI_526]|nr:fungal-specific transcription factor domain-containing protein [Flagelloscypha sp. PMI_526]